MSADTPMGHYETTITNATATNAAVIQRNFALPPSNHEPAPMEQVLMPSKPERSTAMAALLVYPREPLAEVQTANPQVRPRTLPDQ